MALPTPESNALSISHLLTVLGISLGVILSLVGIIYHSVMKTLKDLQDQLNDGGDTFTANAVTLAGLKAELQSVREWLIAAERIIKDLELKMMNDHDKLTEMKQDHKRNHPDGGKK
jgi:hypothetical protein